MNEHLKPKWWRLYIIFPIALVLLAGEAQLALPGWGHKIAQIGIVLFIMGLMGLWLTLNAYALTLAEASDEMLGTIKNAHLRTQMTDAIQQLQAEQSETDATRFDVMRLPSFSRGHTRAGRNN